MSMATQADETWIIGESPPIKHERYSGGWLNQPIWEICSSNWESSPSRGEHKKYIWNHHLVFCLETIETALGSIPKTKRRKPIGRIGNPINSWIILKTNHFVWSTGLFRVYMAVRIKPLQWSLHPQLFQIKNVDFCEGTVRQCPLRTTLLYRLASVNKTERPPRPYLF